ncbi:hypothetical protein ES703_17886 [subsurface metagenome]
MNDEDKTKVQFIKELEELRQRNSELEELEVERKDDKEKIKASEERYKLLFENSGSAIIYIDTEGKYVLLNKRSANHLGGEPGDIIGKSLYDILPEVADFHMKRLSGIIKKGEGDIFEDSIELPGGKRWFSSNIQPVIDERGDVRGVQIISTDITERKRAEEALRESEERYRELADSITDIFFAMDRDLKYTYWNKASEKLTGISAKEAIGKSLYEIFPEVEGKAADKLYLEVLKTKKAQSLENKYRLGNQDFIFELSAYPTKDGCSVFAKDITARKKVEEELRKSEERYRRLFEDSPISLEHEDYSEVKKHIDKLKASGVRDFRKYFAEHPEEVRRCVEMIKPVNVNKATLELYQAEKLEDYNRDIVSIYTEEEFKIFEEQLVALAEDKTVFNSDHAEQTFKGEKKYISMRWFMLPDSQVIIANIDITKQKRAEEQIKASLKEKEILLQEIHHRVRNNMLVVSSLLKLQAGRMKDEKARQAFKESRSRVSAMALVHEALYRSDSMAEIELQKHIPALVDSIYRTFRIKHRVDLKVDIEDIKLSIGQATPLSLVINELISNSIQHAFPEGKGEIIVKVRSSGDDEIEVVVRDNGQGMPEDIDSDKSLGLQLVSGLVESQLDGTWEVIGEEGTQHTIRFKKK